MTEPHYIDIKQAVAETGISERTIRRYLSTGQLTSHLAETPTGKKRVFLAADLIQIKTAAVPPTKNQKSDLTAILNELLEVKQKIVSLENTNRELESQVKDLRAENHQFKEAIIKALPSPSRKPWFWQRRRD